MGTLAAGWAGKRYGKKWLLSGIYAGRSIAAAWFILTPITANSVLIFSFSMGFLWLATVPLTSGLVAHIYGVRYMATLYGIVFFSHQMGSFVGVYLEGGFIRYLWKLYNCMVDRNSSRSFLIFSASSGKGGASKQV